MYTIREIETSEIGLACRMVMAVFREFIASSLEFDDHGYRIFEEFASETAFSARVQGGHFTLVAENGAGPVGVLQVKYPAHVLMMFVDGSCQRQGIATRMMEQATSHIRQRYPNTGEVTVNSSVYAEPVYRNLGFIRAGAPRSLGNLPAIPMKLRIAKSHPDELDC